MPEPLIFIYSLFAVVGVGMWINILWGLVTGGPRATMLPGQPYLYDRLYYLIWFVAICGWTQCLISFAALSLDFVGFIFGWGVCGVGMALIYGPKREMLLKGAKYFSQNGFVAFRFFHKMQVRQFEYMSPLTRTLLPPVFGVAGLVAVIYGLFHWTEVVAQTRAGEIVLLHLIATLKP